MHRPAEVDQRLRRHAADACAGRSIGAVVDQHEVISVAAHERERRKTRRPPAPMMAIFTRLFIVASAV
jgi:hypothetical protein